MLRIWTTLYHFPRHPQRLRTIPHGEINLCVYNSSLLTHITDWFPDLLDTTVPTFCRTGVDFGQGGVGVGIFRQEAGTTALAMARAVEVINEKWCFGEEERFTKHRIWPKRAGEIIDYAFRGCGPASDHRRKYVVAPLAFRDTVETIADAMATPCRNDSTSQAMLAILCKVLVTLPASFRWLLFRIICWYLRVLWALANFGKAIKTPCLLNVSRRIWRWVDTSLPLSNFLSWCPLTVP